MKIFALLAFTLFFSSNAFAAATEISAKVNGMVCAFCAQGITKKLHAEPAVDKVNVSLESKLVTIKLKEGQKLEDDKIQKILKDSGYNVESIARK